MAVSYDDNEKFRLLGSLLEFTRTFYYLRHGRAFITETGCVGRESHYLIVIRELVKIFRLQNKHLQINIPPGLGKSTMVTFFIAWCFAHYSDCKFIYISYSSELAEGHTAEIKAIMQLPIYKKLFGVSVDPTSSARGDFRVLGNHGTGRCVARGSMGSITGLDGGLPNAVDDKGQPRFSGLAIMDDMHKMSEVASDTKRQTVIDNYNGTIKTRRRGIDVGTLIIGQRGHEDDISQFIIDGKDGLPWKTITLQGLDEADNAIAPNIKSREELINDRQFDPYNFYAQQQQMPSPAGGSLFKSEWFKLIPESEMPQFLMTFVVADTAESEAKYADFTAFSFFGIYQIKLNGTVIPNRYGLHWISCREVKIEPKDLEREFLDYWTECLRFKVQPTIAAIEKKSSGTTLVSVLKNVPGIQVIPVEHNATTGSKSTRFIECQRYVAEGLISFTERAKHVEPVITHMAKITANNTHRHDDIADTAEMAIRLTFIERVLLNRFNQPDYAQMAQSFGQAQQKFNRNLRGNPSYSHSPWN